MRAHEKKKLTRKFWASQMKKGLTNNASDGSWGNNANATTTQHNRCGSHGNR